MMEPIRDSRNPLTEGAPLTIQQELCYGYALMEEAIEYMRSRGVSALIALHAYDPLNHREMVDVRLLGSRMVCTGMATSIVQGVVIPSEFTSNLHPEAPSPDVETPFDSLDDIYEDEDGDGDGDGKECEIF